MRRIIISAACALALAAPSAAAMRGEEVRVTVVVRGQTVEFEDQQPIIIGGRTLLPVRGVMESLGASVSWNDDDKCAVITDGSTTVSLTIGEKVMKKGEGADAEEIPLDTAPIIFNERTLLPIRAVAEAFGATVQWEDSTKTITID